jgi:hypothetical protein
MRLTTAQRARLRELCDQHSALNFPTANLGALLDQIDEQEAVTAEMRAELALLRPIAIAADKVTDGIAEFGEPIQEAVEALDAALEPWLKAQEPATRVE